jgi:hypothetical protein
VPSRHGEPDVEVPFRAWFAPCRTRAEAAGSDEVRQLLLQMAEAHEAAARQYYRDVARDEGRDIPDGGWEPGAGPAQA